MVKHVFFTDSHLWLLVFLGTTGMDKPVFMALHQQLQLLALLVLIGMDKTVLLLFKLPAVLPATLGLEHPVCIQAAPQIHVSKGTCGMVSVVYTVLEGRLVRLVMSGMV